MREHAAVFKEEVKMADIVEGAKKYQQYLEKKEIRISNRKNWKMNIAV